MCRLITSCTRHARSLWLAFCVAVAAFLLPALGGGRALAETPRPRTLLGAGDDAWRMGDLAEATRRWGQAIRVCRLEGDARTEMDALARRGEALSAMGRLHEAETDLQAGLAKARQLKQPAMQAAFEGALGNLAFQSKDIRQASEWLRQSIDAAGQAGAVDVLAASTNNQGNVLAANGALAAATETYRKAAEYATAATDLPLQGTIGVNLARVSLRWADQTRAEGKSAEAAAHLKDADTRLAEAARITRALPGSADQVVGLVAITRVALSMHRSAKRGSKAVDLAFVEPVSRQAVATAKALGDLREQSLADGTLAEVLEALGKREEAATLDRNAIWAAQRIDAKDLLWRWEWLNGKLAAAADDRPRAIGAYRRAKATLEE
ncbi:MAG: hypothetical protein JOZ17_12865, partial [Acetobacteraceae bacterium]|nr:hypothetical protein [Acetobacteraceae bacterium]